MVDVHQNIRKEGRWCSGSDTVSRWSWSTVRRSENGPTPHATTDRR